MGTAIDAIVRLDAVTDDAAIAMLANGGERMNGAFETVELARHAVHDDGEGIVVIVSAGFTFGHRREGGLHRPLGVYCRRIAGSLPRA